MRRRNRLRIKGLEDRLNQNYISNNTKKKKEKNMDNQNIHTTTRIIEEEEEEEEEEYDDDFYHYYYEHYSDFEDEEEEEDLEREEEEEGEEEEIGEEEQTSGVMSRLPRDILLDILSRLPIKSLAHCRCVCKSWCKIVHHPRFTKMHHTRATQLNNNHHNPNSLVLHVRYSSHQLRSDIYLVEHEDCDNLTDVATLVNPRFYPPHLEFEVVGSCNGLLCLSEQFYYDPVYVCNPVIGEYIRIPRASKGTDYDIVSGFGYDEVTGKYKVIRMLFESINYASGGNSSFKLEGEIYTLGSGTWRKLGDVPYPLCGKSSPAFVNGALHWMTDEYVGLSVSELIVSFDVGSEEYRVVSPPPGFTPGGESYKYNLGALGGRLCLFDSSFDDRFEIWVMKDYGVKGSWTKEYVISRKVLGLEKVNFRPLTLMKNGEILLLFSSESLVCYDPERKSFRELGIHGLPARFDAITHVGSFVSLRNVVGLTKRRPSGSVTHGRWYRTLYPIPSHEPELDIEWLLEYGLHPLAAQDLGLFGPAHGW